MLTEKEKAEIRRQYNELRLFGGKTTLQWALEVRRSYTYGTVRKKWREARKAERKKIRDRVYKIPLNKQSSKLLNKRWVTRYFKTYSEKGQAFRQRVVDYCQKIWNEILAYFYETLNQLTEKIKASFEELREFENVTEVVEKIDSILLQAAGTSQYKEAEKTWKEIKSLFGREERKYINAYYASWFCYQFICGFGLYIARPNLFAVWLSFMLVVAGTCIPKQMRDIDYISLVSLMLIGQFLYNAWERHFPSALLHSKNPESALQKFLTATGLVACAAYIFQNYKEIVTVTEEKQLVGFLLFGILTLRVILKVESLIIWFLTHILFVTIKKYKAWCKAKEKEKLLSGLRQVLLKRKMKGWYHWSKRARHFYQLASRRAARFRDQKKKAISRRGYLYGFSLEDNSNWNRLKIILKIILKVKELKQKKAGYLRIKEKYFQTKVILNKKTPKWKRDLTRKKTNKQRKNIKN